MATLPNICWQTLKDICDAYANGLIFKLKKYRIVELGLSTSNKGKNIKDSMLERPCMFIGWFCPLQGFTTNEHILFCKQLTSDSEDKKNKYYDLMEIKVNLNWPIGVMFQNVKHAFKIHLSGWNLNVLIHLMRKKLVTDR